MIQISFQTYAQTGLHHKTPIPPPPLPLVHNPQVTLWVGIQLLTPVVQIYAQYHSAMHNGKTRGGGGGGGDGWQKQAK